MRFLVETRGPSITRTRGWSIKLPTLRPGLGAADAESMSSSGGGGAEDACSVSAGFDLFAKADSGEHSASLSIL